MPVRVILAVFMISLVPFGNSWAQERSPVGEVLLGSAWVDIKGGKAKFNEYGDLRNGVSSGIDLHVEGGKTYFGLQAGHIGRGDQAVDLHGGSRGGFSYQFHYDEIPHLLSSGPAVHR